MTSFKVTNKEDNRLPRQIWKKNISIIPIIPTQCFIVFFGDFDWSVGKIKCFLHFNKTRAYEYLISAMISQCS